MQAFVRGFYLHYHLLPAALFFGGKTSAKAVLHWGY